MGEIVDNSPELDLSDPKTLETLEALKEPKVETKDVKKAEASSAPETPVKASPEQPEEDPRDAQIKGLQAELARRKGNADKVHELEEKVSQLEKAPKQDPYAEVFSKKDDKELLSLQSQWEAELSYSTAKYAAAEERENVEAQRLAAERIRHAQEMLSRIRGEKDERSERKATQRKAEQEEYDLIRDEISQMHADIYEAFPDFQNEDSELWKAGNQFYLDNPGLMNRMGAAGEVVAAAMAVVKNPELVKGGKAQAVREVVSKIDKGFGKAMRGGSSAPNANRTTDYTSTVNTSEGLDQFNKMIDKIKGG